MPRPETRQSPRSALDEQAYLSPASAGKKSPTGLQTIPNSPAAVTLGQHDFTFRMESYRPSLASA